MSVFKLTESQYRRLFEATDGQFDASKLSEIHSFAERVRYCREHLGEPVGNGSARMVFQIDDSKCVKLAKNQKGIAQNEVEDDRFKQRFDIFPKIYDSDDNGLWIECEYVLPARTSDFKNCLGFTFEKFKDWCWSTFSRYNRYYRDRMSDEEYGEMLENSPFLQDMEDYLTNYQVADNDIISIRNWGLALRDGEALPVLLDHGLNDDVFNRYYRR